MASPFIEGVTCQGSANPNPNARVSINDQQFFISSDIDHLPINLITKNLKTNYL